MTTNEEIIPEQLITLWETGFDDGWFFKGATHPKVEKALDWLKKNHPRGKEFAKAIQDICHEINGAQEILWEIYNDLTPKKEE